MKQGSFDFDQRSIDAAVARIKEGADFVAALRGFVPTDPLAANALQQRLKDVREALDVMSRLVDAVDRARPRAAKGKQGR